MDERLWRQRWRRAWWVAVCFRLLPFVRLVGLNGSMVTGKMSAGSDIDLFVVGQRRRLYLVRALCIATVRLLGWRTDGETVAGRICLNRFASTANLAVLPANQYHADVFHNLVPLYATPLCYAQYREANRWMAAFGRPPTTHRPALSMPLWLHLVKSTVELAGWPLWEALERLARRWQCRRIASDPRLHGTESILVLTADEIRFHYAPLPPQVRPTLTPQTYHHG